MSAKGDDSTMTGRVVVGTLVRVKVWTSSIVDEGDRQVSVSKKIQQSSVLWSMHVEFVFLSNYAVSNLFTRMQFLPLE